MEAKTETKAAFTDEPQVAETVGEVIVQKDVAPAPTALATPGEVVMYAMRNGGSLADIRELMQLQREWEADQARKAYISDMAEFKKNPPTIVKNKLVSYTPREGGPVVYYHATLSEVTGKIIDALARHGFSHRWDTEQLDNGQIAVTCVITHKMGHSERNTLHSSRDDSGKKNNIQAMGSAITYLQRYTLLAALGLATEDQDADDDDGAASGANPDEIMRRAMNAKTIDDLAKIWDEGQDIILPDNKELFAKFKGVVNKRKAELEAAAAANSPGKKHQTRLSKIVGSAKAGE